MTDGFKFGQHHSSRRRSRRQATEPLRCPFSAEEIDFAKRFIKRRLRALKEFISLCALVCSVAKWVVIILSTFWMFGDKAGLLAYARYSGWG